jgi:hypothetical protein
VLLERHGAAGGGVGMAVKSGLYRYEHFLGIQMAAVAGKVLSGCHRVRESCSEECLARNMQGHESRGDG